MYKMVWVCSVRHNNYIHDGIGVLDLVRHNNTVQGGMSILDLVRHSYVQYGRLHDT